MDESYDDLGMFLMGGDAIFSPVPDPPQPQFEGGGGFDFTELPTPFLGMPHAAHHAPAPSPKQQDNMSASQRKARERAALALQPAMSFSTRDKRRQGDRDRRLRINTGIEHLRREVLPGLDGALKTDKATVVLQAVRVVQELKESHSNLEKENADLRAQLQEMRNRPPEISAAPQASMQSLLPGQLFLFHVSANGIVIDINQALLQALGMTREQVVGQHVSGAPLHARLMSCDQTCDDDEADEAKQPMMGGAGGGGMGGMQSQAAKFSVLSDPSPMSPNDLRARLANHRHYRGPRFLAPAVLNCNDNSKLLGLVEFLPIFASQSLQSLLCIIVPGRFRIIPQGEWFGAHIELYNSTELLCPEVAAHEQAMLWNGVGKELEDEIKKLEENGLANRGRNLHLLQKTKNHTAEEVLAWMRRDAAVWPSDAALQRKVGRHVSITWI